MYLASEATIRNIAAALLSGSLFWLFRHISS
jgi:hypothetical protein